MTNGDRAQKMVEEAQAIQRDMAQSFDEKRWNHCIRRAQEIVELVLKGLLFQMGVDYPKWHDVGHVFSRVVHEKGLSVEEEFLIWLIGFSEKMAGERAPAFYYEEDYTEEEASQAREGAMRVLEFGRAFLQTLRQSHS